MKDATTVVGAPMTVVTVVLNTLLPLRAGKAEILVEEAGGAVLAGVVHAGHEGCAVGLFPGEDG